MTWYETVWGGGTHHQNFPPQPHPIHGHSGYLNDPELLAAQQALSKLGGTVGGFFQSLTLDAPRDSTSGEGYQVPILKSLIGGLVAGQGADTYAGGAQSARFAISKFSADSVHGGSTGPHLPSVHNSASFHLSSDTINLAGTTAARLKAIDSTHAQQASHTITLSDKTTLTLTGIHSHDIVKPHGH